jgi:hypothetical protein
MASRPIAGVFLVLATGLGPAPQPERVTGWRSG